MEIFRVWEKTSPHYAAYDKDEESNSGKINDTPEPQVTVNVNS